MEHKKFDKKGLSTKRGSRLFYPESTTHTDFPILSVEIDWERLMANRKIVLATINSMPPYLLKPEAIEIMNAEKHPTYRLIMDLMWSTGAKVSEVLAITPSSFLDNEYGKGVFLRTLKQSGRPTKKSLQRSPKRFVPILDKVLWDRIESFLCVGGFKTNQRIFTMTRQTVGRHVKAAVKRVGRAPFSIHPETFRHSFAIHLLLHGRPLKYLGQLLGNKSVGSIERYTNVLTVDGSHFLEGVDFH